MAQIRGGKNIVILALAVVLAAAGAFFTNQYINQEIEAVKASLAVQEQPEMAAVIVPNRDLPRGTVVMPGDLVKRSVPAEWLHSGVVTEANYTTAVGQEIAFDADYGKPLLWAHLKGGSAPTFSGRLPEGMRALTIKVDEISSVSGFLQPQDRVDLLLSYKQSKKKITRPLMQNVVVLATGQRVEMDKSGQAQLERSHGTVTLLVSPKDAKRLVVAQENGSLTAVLRNPRDEDPMNNDQMTIAGLFSDNKPVVRRRVAKRRGIEFIIGGI